MLLRMVSIGFSGIFLSGSIVVAEEFISSPSVVASITEMTGTTGAPEIDCLEDLLPPSTGGGDPDGNGIADDVENNPAYPAACTMLDAPLSTFRWGQQSISTVIRTPEILHVTSANSAASVSERLNNPYSQISWVKKTCAKDSDNKFCLPWGDGTDDYAFTDMNGMTDVHSLWFTDVFVPDLGAASEMLAFMHEERVADTGGPGKASTEGNHGMTRLGLAWSEDFGNTWSYLGRIVTTYLNKPIINIQGAPYLVVGDYLYVYYKEDDGVGRNVGVARALISEVVAAAKSNTPGVSDWHKYVIGEDGQPRWDNTTTANRQGANPPGSFTDSDGNPVSVGDGFPVFKPVLLDLHNGVVHTQAMRVDRAVGGNTVSEYFIVTAGQTWNQSNTQIILYRSSDGLNWTNETVIDAEAPGQVMSQGNTRAGGYLYCSTTPTDGRPNHISSNDRFYIYCQDLSQKIEVPDPANPGSLRVENEPSLRSFYRWEVNLNVGDNNSFKNSESFDGMQGPEWTYHWGQNNTVLGEMNWNSVLWSGNEAINRVRISPVDGINASRADYVGNTQMHPGDLETPVLRWTAPKDGTIKIDGVARDANPNCGDGVELSVLHNDNSLLSTSIDNRDTVGVSISRQNSLVEVLQGDYIEFHVEPRSNNDCDSTTWDPSIVYRSVFVQEPVADAVLTGASENIVWVDNGVDVAQWWLYVGSTQGSSQHYNSGALSANELSRTVNTLPLDGSTVYVRLWYRKAVGAWEYIDTTYTAFTDANIQSPAITDPVQGSTLDGISHLFNWTANDIVVDKWWLYAGSNEGTSNYYNSGSLTSTGTTVTGLPADGSTVYVRLWYLAGGTWLFKDTSYVAAALSAPEISSPANLSVLNGSTATLNWTANDTTVDEWWITMGSIYGISNLYSSGVLQDTNVTVTGLPTDGNGIYVRLWYRATGGTWNWSEAYYVAADIALPEIVQPTVGSTLTGTEETFSWVNNDAVIDQWWLYAGSSVGGNQYYDSGARGAVSFHTATNLPSDGSTVYVRLWYKENGGNWLHIDATYQATQ